ncbi:MAG: albumin-binding GA domain-containing protein [Finegoldia magna]|nr:albumin-binding GA domain-containing protein [Finegoldia magna]
MKNSKKLWKVMSGITLAATLLAPINTFADDYLGEVGDPGAVEKSYDDAVADYWNKKFAEEEKAEKEAKEKAEKEKAAKEKETKKDSKALEEAKKQAIADLKANGITSKLFLDKIESAKTVEGVKSLKAELIKAHKQDPEKVLEKETKENTNKDKNSEKEYLDKAEKEYNKIFKQEELKKAKEKAIAELKANGITSKFFIDRINAGKTVEGVKALKEELIKSHKNSSKDVDKALEEASKEEYNKWIKAEQDYEKAVADYWTKKIAEDEKAQADKKAKEENQAKENVVDKIKNLEKALEDATKQKEELEKVKKEKEELSKQLEKMKSQIKKDVKKDGKKEDKKAGKDQKANNPKKANKNVKVQNRKTRLPKAGSEAEVVTLAAAALTSVAGAFISLKKRK